MKDFTLKLRHTALVLTTALAVSACQNEQSGEGSALKISIIHPVTFNICEVETKTSFGQGQDGVYPTLWTSNDAFVKLAVNYSSAIEAAVVPSGNFRTASFTADIDASSFQAPYTFYAVSPASAAKALSPSRQAWNVTIPSVQTPLEGSVDEAAMLLAAASQPSDAIPQSVDIHFNHLTAYGRMSFTNLALDGATVEKVEITASTPFVGDWYWDCTGEHAITDNGASSTLTLITGSTADIWFACAPVDMSGETLEFTVFTDKGVFYKEVTVPDGRKFNPGRIAVFSVDMSGVETAYAGDGECPLTQYSELGVYQDSRTRTYVRGTDQYIRSYSDSGEQTFIIMDPAANEQIRISGYRKSLVKGDPVTVTLYWKKGQKTIVPGASYSMTVVKEEGPRVWLADGSGYGFIIKK